jgi:hypothetical protein
MKPAPKPKRKPVRARPKQIIIWLGTDEHARLVAAAKACGLGLGPWLRSLGLAAARRAS